MAACSRSDHPSGAAAHQETAMFKLNRWPVLGLLSVVAAAATVVSAGPRTAPAADPYVGGTARADRSAPAVALPELASAAVAARTEPIRGAYEGVVEAQRQTVVASQVPGAVVAVLVSAGDRVRAGQVLLRIDARAAEQAAMAGAAQSRAARAGLEESASSYARQQELFAQGFISGAALDRAKAQMKTADAEATAQLASAGAARSQSEWYVVRSPYAGVVSKVSVVLGDMALPGRPLLTLHDPSALRITAAIPQSVVAGANGSLAPLVEIPGVGSGWITPARTHLLPVVDAASHTQELRMDLPAGTHAAPGTFARTWLADSAASAAGKRARLFVPSETLVRRAELVAVYVVGRDGKPALRQVRLGHSVSGEVEILSGVAAGERVALDPRAAARVR
jgi:membrane fusion protein, multidrug efflux system